MIRQTPATPVEIADDLAPRFGVTANALGDLVTYDRTGSEPSRPERGAFEAAVAAYGPANQALRRQVRDLLPQLTDEELVSLETRRFRATNPDPTSRRAERRSLNERARRDVGAILRRWLPDCLPGRHELPAVWGDFKNRVAPAAAVLTKYPDARHLGRTHFYEELADAAESLTGMRVVRSGNCRVLIIEAD